MTAAIAAHRAMQRQLRLARRGRSWIHALTSGSTDITPWAHYPARDAIDASGCWQFYFHSHPEVALDHVRDPREQGHVHLFRRGPGGTLSHLTGLSLDERGAPLQWFAPNLWVTGGRWLRTGTAARLLRAPDLRLRGPLAGVALWLTDLLCLYRQPLLQMLRQRDAAIERHCAEQCVTPRQARTDRRIALWQSTPIEWPRDAVAAIEGSPRFC